MKIKGKEQTDIQTRETKGSTGRRATCNQGSATVEMTIIMFVYMMIIIMLFQGFFLLLSHTGNYYAKLGADRDCSIEKTVKALRRWQFIDRISG